MECLVKFVNFVNGIRSNLNNSRDGERTQAIDLSNNIPRNGVPANIHRRLNSLGLADWCRGF